MFRFAGRTLDEAMDRAFTALGDDARILTARYVTKRMPSGSASTWAEVTAVSAEAEVREEAA